MIVTNSLNGGGAERSMNLVCNELAMRGWPISLVPINASPPDLVTPNCEVFPLERQWKGSLVNTFVAAAKFKNVVSKWNPDLIVLNCDLPEIFGATLLSRRNLVVLEHSSIPWGKRAAVGKIVRFILKKRKTTWAAVSSHLRIWSLEETPSAILQNPLTPNERILPRAIESEIKRLLFVGRLSPEKRADFVFEIAQRSGIRLEVIGDGLLRRSLEKKAHDEGIDVHFHGWIANPWSLIQPGDLLIVPSLFEGDGLIVLEGLQLNMPLLLADIPDFRRFGFPERNYCLSVADFISRIGKFKNELHDLEIPEAISRRLTDPRSIQEIASKWETFLDSIPLRR
jgi:glycosyltransferase involved in cell wall biosynthesis